MNPRLGLILGVLALASIAVAGESSYLLNSTNQASAPSGAAQTGAVTITNGIRGVGLAIADYDDGGGQNQDLISTAVRGSAWIFPVSQNTTTPLYVSPDGGGGWLRYPRLDVVGFADAGGALAVGNGAQGQFFTVDPVVTGGFIGSKLYYTTAGTVYDDGGIAVHKVTITTLY